MKTAPKPEWKVICETATGKLDIISRACPEGKRIYNVRGTKYNLENSARRSRAKLSNCKLYLVLCTLFWWLDAYSYEIAKAILYILLGALASPFILCAALGLYENAVRDDEPVDEAYWMRRGYEPLNTLPPTDEL